jgi:hypothetical protein
MTCHRLIHCQPDQLVHLVSRRARVELQPPHQVMAVWLPHGGRVSRTVLGWRQPWLGTRSIVTCCLEMERSATGVIAHLSTVTGDRLGSLPRSISTVVVNAWTARLLDQLAAGVEAEQRSTRDTEPGRNSSRSPPVQPA